MTLFVPLYATATSKSSSGDQQTDVHIFASAADRAVQVVPVGEVMTLFVPSDETATNNARSGDQQTDSH